MHVEVVFALPDRQVIVQLQLESGATAREAIEQSGLTGQFPDLDLAGAKAGVFGKLLDDPATYQIQDGDRVEIYRPLRLDPKEARRLRAEQAKRNLT